jgi:phosphoribosylglycinamide formyltransferase-1
VRGDSRSAVTAADLRGPVFEAALAAGVTESGVSIHVVDSEYDTGPLVARCRVPIQPGDSPSELKARTQAREREFVVETLAAIAQNQITLGRTV